MYRLNDEQQRIAATAAAVAERELAPRAAGVDRDAAFPQDSIAALGANGLLGLTVPKAQGGLGQGLRTAVAVIDEVAQRCASTAMVYLMHLCGVACYAAAPDKTAPLLEAAAAGRHLSTLAFSEKGSRSHFWAPVSRASGSGNGAVSISARKSFVTSAGHADGYVVSTQFARGSADATRADRQDAHRHGSRPSAPRRRPRFAGVAWSGDAVDGARGQGVGHRNGGGGHRNGDADVRRRGLRRGARHRAPVPRRAGADRDGADERRRLRVHRPRPVRPGGVLMSRPLKVGAVMYDPKVSVIWEIIRDFFDAQGAPIDVAFYSTYEDQNDGLLSGAIDIAWNSPLAWVDAQRRSGNGCRAIAMRDTDRDRISYVVARRSGPVQTLADLKGHTIATGAIDSPQATLIPLGRLRREGLSPGVDVTVRRFDVLVGKHGDHVGGEREALACLTQGDAAACAMLDLNWEGWIKDGTIDANEFSIVGETDRFDHCVFTVRQALDPSAEKAWLDALFAMRYDNPAHREMMDLEGLRAWLPGRTTGFGPLTAAVESERFFAPVSS